MKVHYNNNEGKQLVLHNVDYLVSQSPNTVTIYFDNLSKKINIPSNKILAIREHI